MAAPPTAVIPVVRVSSPEAARGRARHGREGNASRITRLCRSTVDIIFRCKRGHFEAEKPKRAAETLEESQECRREGRREQGGRRTVPQESKITPKVHLAKWVKYGLRALA